MTIACFSLIRCHKLQRKNYTNVKHLPDYEITSSQTYNNASEYFLLFYLKLSKLQITRSHNPSINSFHSFLPIFLSVKHIFTFISFTFKRWSFKFFPYYRYYKQLSDKESPFVCVCIWYVYSLTVYASVSVALRMPTKENERTRELGLLVVLFAADGQMGEIQNAIEDACVRDVLFVRLYVCGHGWAGMGGFLAHAREGFWVSCEHIKRVIWIMNGEYRVMYTVSRARGKVMDTLGSIKRTAPHAIEG